MIGSLGKANFTGIIFNYDDNLVYCLKLIIDQDTMMTLQIILNNDSLKNMNNVNYSLLDHTVTFSAKLKTLNLTDALLLCSDDSFSFLFDDRNMIWELKVLLKNYFAKQLSHDDMLAVETNISSYDISVREDFLTCTDYFFSLLSVYFIVKDDLSLDEVSTTSLKFDKCQKDSLMSSRRNKKTEQLAVFSDENWGIFILCCVLSWFFLNANMILYHMIVNLFWLSSIFQLDASYYQSESM